nr:SbcC/MukB-like Walker B domain-containing protein [Methylomarinum sp. Ch1-1]MDP4520884.1 SbcC/MukB-like Walker B domain-containing protein [Methylomarinum sp. Ch1-1]
MQRQLETRQQEVDSSAGALQQLEQARMQDIASHLAAQLQQGQPCAVCGSHDHPLPATPPAHIPADEQLEAARQNLQAAEKQLSEIRQDFDHQRRELDRIAGVLDELKTVGAESEISRDDCQADIDLLKRQAHELTLQAEQKQLLKNRQGQLKTAIKNDEDALTGLRTRLGECQSQVSTLAGQIQSQLERIPELYRDKADLNPEIAALERQIQQFDRRLDEASRAHHAAQQRFNTAQGVLNGAQKQRLQASADFESKQRLITGLIEQSPFADIAALKSSKLTEQEVRSQTEQVEHYREETRRIESRLDELATQLTGKANPDLAPLQDAYRQAQTHKNDCLERRIRLDEQHRVLDKLINKIAKEQQALEAATQEYEQASHLSRIANGSGHQGSKLSFSRYLLGRLLDEILQSASSRLYIMSEGRYRLIRKLDQANKRSAFGLDIELTDAYTGQKRSVSTFSGGEGFLASLSLALGLSEVVRSNAGGIQLDTLFIDEGFGSLNDEALEQAINVLTMLSGDGRLVGVISHVNELKERIDAQLVVSKTANGSSAEFVL